MADTCRGCVYYRPLSGGEPTLCCHYALDNERLRECPAENCKKKLTLEEVMKRLTQEEKRQIVRLRISEKMSPKEIAERFGIARQTVNNIVCEWKDFVEAEVVDELDRKAVDDAADDDYACYEVTGDTDIEAYMSDRNVKKPDTAATVTDSEQEIVCENIPADIVTQETGNVKPDDILPCAVVDAVADQIDRLYDRLTECDREMQKIRDARENAESGLKELKAFLKKNGFGDVVKALDSGAKWRALQGEK